MKTMSKIALCLTLGLMSAGAVAGLYLAQPVTVDLVAQSAQGDMWSARYSSTDDAFIGCGVTSVDDGTQFAFCQALDAEGDLILCAVDSAILIESIKSITSDSVILFLWDDTGLCTVINVATQSYAIRRTRNVNWGL